jgi:putative aldouronate transport system permease protein
LEHFLRFITGPQFAKLIQNTLGLSVVAVAVGFPAPIILTLLINELQYERFKKAVQTVTCTPNFISMVVIVGMLIQFLSPTAEFVNKIIVARGGRRSPSFRVPNVFAPSTSPSTTRSSPGSWRPSSAPPSGSC